MSQKKYASLQTLQTFLTNLKNIFAELSHKHTMSDIADYVVDAELSATSTNPVQNKVLDAELEAVATAMNALDAAIENKAEAPKLTNISLPAANWTGDANPWSQVVNINGVTKNSKIDLQPSAHQLVALCDNDIALMAENDDGVIAVYALGGKPEVDYTMQALITEVVFV